MAEEELQLISLRDDFYRDGYYKALAIIGVLLIAIALLVSASLYLQLSKPDPVVFGTGDEFRTLLPVPVDKPYPTEPDLLQWASDVIPKAFTYDFINYNLQFKNASQYFTPNGLKSYTDQLKMYVDYNTIISGKLFSNAVPTSAPVIRNKGLLPEGVYAWLIEMSINLSYSNVNRGNAVSLLIQAIVVRVPTLNNLSGVAIEKLTVLRGAGDQIISNG